MQFIKNYFSQVISELKKVSWPDKKQTINKTVLVLIVSSLVALYIAGVDFLMKSMMGLIIK